MRRIQDSPLHWHELKRGASNRTHSSTRPCSWSKPEVPEAAVGGPGSSLGSLVPLYRTSCGAGLGDKGRGTHWAERSTYVSLYGSDWPGGEASLWKDPSFPRSSSYLLSLHTRIPSILTVTLLQTTGVWKLRFLEVRDPAQATGQRVVGE